MTPTSAPPKDVLPLPDEGFGSLGWWHDAIKAGEDARDRRVEQWKKNVDSYLGDRKKTDDDVPVNVDFYNTEQKKAQLFFRTPEVQLTAKRPGLEDAVTVFQAVINHKLGRSGVNAAAMMDEVLFDCLCPAGLMASVIGYEAIADGETQIQVGMKPGEPAPGSILGLNAPMVPDLRPVPKIISERYFWDRLSPAKLILPADFHGSDYDKAPWLAYECVEDLAVAKRRGWVPDDFGGSGEDKHRLVSDPSIENRGPLVVVRYVYYRASRVDEAVKHPDKIRQLVLVDGLNSPAVHRDSPYQKFDPTTGKMIGGMKGFPIHVGALRYVSDSAYPPSDCTISRHQVDELRMERTRMAQQRKRSLPLRWADRNRLAPEDLDRIKRSEVQGIIPVDGNGSDIIGEVARAEYPRENFGLIEVIQQDIDKEWALGSNQQGVKEDTVRSATELSLIQGNINVRQDYERTKVLSGYFVPGVEKLGSLIQLFADDTDYVEIQGPDGAKRLQAWDKTTIAGEFAYSAKPDSAKKVDAAQDRKQFLDYTNFNAKNPNVNLLELSRIGATKFDLDPARIIKTPDPPPPDKPAISFRFSGADLGIPEVRLILGGAGIKLPPVPSPQALQATTEAMMAQAAKSQPHGGTADKQEPLSKHSGEETGQLSGPTNAAAVN